MPQDLTDHTPIAINLTDEGMTVDTEIKEFLAGLRRRNEEFYSDPRGKGALKDLQQTFPHPWLYVAELLQNAIDEGASRICITIVDNNQLIFEHDGEPFNRDDVESLCARGVSSKGAATVGFMGVGFKAVFRSYEKVQVISPPWRFSLSVPSVKGERFGDLQRDWIGAVLPQWDEDNIAMSQGMRCKFVLSERLPDLGPIQGDLDRLFGEDKTLLALLAWRGVTELTWNGSPWVLSKSVTRLNDEGDCRILLEALDQTGSDLLRWMMFETQYQPSDGAVRRFLEHRQLDPAPEDRERVYAEASRLRQVAVFVGLSNDDAPLPVERGAAFALLPTGVTFPLGVHVQADWLLVISRQEIMQIEGNEWHEGILLQLPRLLRNYLAWLVSDGRGADWEKGYEALPGVCRSDSEADWWFEEEEFHESFANEVADLAFLPAPSADDSGIDFLMPSEARTLPRALAKTFDQPLMKPRSLFGDPVISSRLLGPRASNFIAGLSLVSELTADELGALWDRWVVGEWLKKFDEGESDKLLAQLLGALADLDSNESWKKAELKCLPTESGDWTTRGELKRFPAEWNMLVQEPDINSALGSFLGPKDTLLSWSFDRYINRTQSQALRFVEKVLPPKLEEIVNAWWESLPELPDAAQAELVLKFTSWVRGKQAQRKSLVRKVLCSSDNHRMRLLPAEETLLADPYAGVFRRSFFNDLPSIAPEYLKQAGTTAADWRSFFESLPKAPEGPFQLKLTATKLGWFELKDRLGSDYTPPSTRSSQLTKPWRGLTVENNSYRLLDAHLPEGFADQLKNQDLDEVLIRNFSNWVLETPSMLREYPTLIVAYIPYFQSEVVEAKVSHPASWVQDLSEEEWVFTTKGEGPFRPSDLLPHEDPVRPDAPVAALPTESVTLLEAAGVSFGAALPEAPAIERLNVQGPESDPETLLKLLQEAVAEAEGDEEKTTFLQQVLADRPLFPVPPGTNPIDGSRRVPCRRIVSSLGGRSTLADWIIPMERFTQNSPERDALEVADTIWPLRTSTTADHVMDFLLWVWEVQPDANRVRGFMPRAYQYLREDLAADKSANVRWEEVSHHAKVFTVPLRKWVEVAGNERVFLDDLNQPSLHAVVTDLELATPGHLGGDPTEQVATAELLSLKLLSSRFRIEVRPEGPLPIPDHWRAGFNLIQKQLRGRLDSPVGDDDEPVAEIQVPVLGMTRWRTIRTHIYDMAVEVYSAPSLASIYEGAAAVAGEPRDFAKELCPALCDYWGLRRRHDLPEILTDLAIRLTEISDSAIVASWTIDSSKRDGDTGVEEYSTQDSELQEPLREDVNTVVPTPFNEESRGGKGGGYSAGGGNILSKVNDESKPRPKRNRLLSYVASPGAVIEGPPDTESAERRSQIDEAGIERVKSYEASSGRDAEIMPHNNEGFDIKSYADGRIARYIEVKSLSGDWDVDNVKMTHPQFEHAVEKGERYWLYVVERAESKDYKIHRIQNPASQVMYFVFDYIWQGVEEEEEAAEIPQNAPNTDYAS
jgi:hypothetical protein